MRLHFMGGADTVTGSQHIIEANGHLVLRDCGMFQGRRKEAEEINSRFLYEPSHLHSMVLSHAHIDHCGVIPKLVAGGYTGPIHATKATVAITEIMLKDSARIQEQDAAYLNQKTNRKDLLPVKPLYMVADADIAMKQMRGHSYHDRLELAPGLSHESFDAGHVLGSALSVFTVREDARTTRVGYAVDLGRRGLPIIRDPENIGSVDVLVLESTYGDRLHDDAGSASDQLRAVITRTLERGGKVLIPAFALERVQEIVYHIGGLLIEGQIPRVPVYVDSPMATAITKVFDQQSEIFDAEARQRLGDVRRRLGVVSYTASVEESKAVTTSDRPAIIIAASGMCESGRIVHHLKAGIGDPRNSIAIVGFQAVNTLGRRLVDGEKRVKIFGDEFEVRAEIGVLKAFSAHADRNELIDYVRRIRPKTTYLVHGEQKPREALAEALHAEKLTSVHLPARGDVIEL